MGVGQEKTQKNIAKMRCAGIGQIAINLMKTKSVLQKDIQTKLEMIN